MPEQAKRRAGQADMNDVGTQPGRPPRLLPGSDAAVAYRMVYERVAELLGGRNEVAELPVPACPDWTVGQTVAHLAGVAQDVVALNLEGLATEPWTRAQVDRLGGNGVDELLDLWGQMIDPVAVRLAHGAPEEAAGQLVFDALTHEHDIRGALGAPGLPPDDLTFEVVAEFLTMRIDQMLRADGLLSLRLTTPKIGSLQLGDPAAAERASLDVSDFEALRAFGGRRSARQLLALPWQGDPANLLSGFGNDAIRPPEADLIE